MLNKSFTRKFTFTPVCTGFGLKRGPTRYLHIAILPTCKILCVEPSPKNNATLIDLPYTGVLGKNW